MLYINHDNCNNYHNFSVSFLGVGNVSPWNAMKYGVEYIYGTQEALRCSFRNT
jgi:hypothetical protein